MRLLVCGGREFSDRATVFAVLDMAHARRPIAELFHGDARGADRLAGEWALAMGVPCTAVPAHWKTLGKRAGVERNERMLAMRPDGVVAFPGGRGTAHMVRIAAAAGIPVWQPIRRTADSSRAD